MCVVTVVLFEAAELTYQIWEARERPKRKTKSRKPKWWLLVCSQHAFVQINAWEFDHGGPEATVSLLLLWRRLKVSNGK